VLIDLCAEPQISVALGAASVHVQLRDLKITFAVDRHDLPAAWADLRALVARRMTVPILRQLLDEILLASKRGYQDGGIDARGQIRKALGL
jgi:hypothetical protein